MKKHILAASWPMLPAVTPRSIQIARQLSALVRLDREVTLLAKLMTPATDLLLFDAILAEKYAKTYNSITIDLARHYRTRLKKILRKPTGDWDEDIAFHAASAARLRNTPPDILITFAQPFRILRIGLQLRAAFPRIPWVAHFSDPWVDNPYAEPREQDFADEKAVIERADAVIFTTERTRSLVMKKYSANLLEKTYVIPHCFEKEALRPPTPIPAEGPLEILHTGNVYDMRMPLALLFALLQLRQESVFDIHVRFLGHVQPLFKKLVNGYRLEGAVFFSPEASPAVCAEECRAADMLLACDAPAKESVFLPSKLVDYLAARRPILAITPQEGSTADFIREVGGFYCSPESPEDIATTLRMLLQQKRAGRLADALPAPEALTTYESDTCAKAFAAVLDGVTTS